MSKKKSSAQSEAHDLARVLAVTDTIKKAFALGPHAIWAFCLYKSVEAVAGHETKVTALIDWAVKADVSKWAYLLVAGLLGGGWIVEKRLRKKEVAELSSKVKVYEERLDPKRTTSRLNAFGERDEKVVEGVVTNRLESGEKS